MPKDKREKRKMDKETQFEGQSKGQRSKVKGQRSHGTFVFLKKPVNAEQVSLKN
jgi:hypothetical protein